MICAVHGDDTSARVANCGQPCTAARSSAFQSRRACAGIQVSKSELLARAIDGHLMRSSPSTNGVVALRRVKRGGQEILFESNTGALFYGADGTDTQAAVQFAQLGLFATVNASDFVIG